MNKRPYNRSDWRDRALAPVRRVSETDPDIARDTLSAAVLSCELAKARAQIRAKVFVDRLEVTI